MIILAALALIVLVLAFRNPLIRCAAVAILITASVTAEVRHDREVREAAEAADAY